MKILLTGGAGFIGSHTYVELLKAGHEAVIVDNFYNASEHVLDRLKTITGQHVCCYNVDVTDAAELDKVFASHSFDAVIHFAGYKAVGESVGNPLEYYRNNLDSTLTLLEAIQKTINGVTGESYFDRYASEETKEQVRQAITSQTSSEALDRGSIPNMAQKEPQAHDFTNAMDPESATAYVCLATAQNALGGKWTFKAVDGVRIPDEDAPVLLKVTTTVTKVNDAADPVRVSGTVTLQFSETIYHINDSGNPDTLRAIIQRDVECTRDIRIIIPAKTLQELLKIMGGADDDVKIDANRRYVVFTSNGYTIMSRLIEGDFLNYESVIPKDRKTRVTVECKNFIDTIERASLIITERLKNPLRISFAEDRVTVRCQTPLGKVVDEFAPVSMEGDAVEIGFNNRYLLDALRFSKCEKMVLEINGPLSPVKLLPEDGKDFIYLVLPVRFKNEG